jgi:hypothetical protein
VKIDKITDEEFKRRLEISMQHCTLDGIQAKISGIFYDKALVWSTKIPSNHIKLDWQTVFAVMEDGGQFATTEVHV